MDAEAEDEFIEWLETTHLRSIALKVDHAMENHEVDPLGAFRQRAAQRAVLQTFIWCVLIPVGLLICWMGLMCFYNFLALKGH